MEQRLEAGIYNEGCERNDSLRGNEAFKIMTRLHQQKL